MPRKVVPLTDSAIKSAKAKDRPYKLSDGDGLYLDIKSNGSKLWRFKYRFGGKAKTPLSLGPYPTLTLLKARQKREEYRSMVVDGLDPGEQKKLAKHALATNSLTFEVVAREWIAYQLPRWAKTTCYKVNLYFNNDIIPAIGYRSIKSITRPELVELVRAVESRGTLSAAGKIRQWLHQVFSYGLAKGIVDRNPATDLNVLAAAPKGVRHHPHIPFVELPGLLERLDTTHMHTLTRLAISLIMLTAVRPCELRAAPWSEFDLESGTWTIPKERMKARRAHVVPLSHQALRVLEELKKISGSYTLLFPGQQNIHRPMSENTINKALGLMGYKNRQTGHGFRHMLSTELNGRGFNRDWIEKQLAHADTNGIRDTYNHADYIDQRRAMMQQWADSIDTLKANPNVINIKRAG